MTYWKKVLKEVLNRKNLDEDFIFTNLAIIAKEHLHKKRENPTHTKAYCLGNNFGNIHFSRREAECMLCLLKGKTIKGAAKHLRLSPRTVEFYIKNMKQKIGCQTKPELIELILRSELLQQIDF